MSSSAADDDLAQEILDAYARLFVENYCIIASSGLLFVDTLFTFTDEVQRIWRRRFTGATLIFLLTRWVAVAERIVLVVSVVLPTVQDKSCVPVLRLDDTLTDISYLMFGVFMMLRVRGVWGGAWAPLVFLALLTPVRTIISIYTQTHYDPIAFGGPIYGCGAVINLDSHRYTTVGIVSRISGLAIDTAVLLLTWYKTLGIKRESTRLGIHTPYVTLLLRDGTLYFLIILFIQTFGIISIAVGSDFVLFAVWPYFDQVFTVIFLTRFMLNLRGVYLSDPSDVHGTPLPNTTDRTATISGMRFSSSIVGNMGAPLNSSLFSDSYGSSTLSAHESDRSTDMEGWRVEDETLETSENPLFAGLGKGDEQGVEMLQTRTQE
ncbi:hypothetical protein L226DRAFT_613552 [Lentinus tigrinus ALCF2SS1-7]|uniref:uncharacterized protein n=1 Tax=Lentinus tigrinus ALCF2SS1-7 TaxID=1328758 RepID=UPI001165F36E|nr:hypothetical protein L226DRAFT_613552 [Lentinus tigrinus ALCF2SS1-7]